MDILHLVSEVDISKIMESWESWKFVITLSATTLVDLWFYHVHIRSYLY